MRAVTWGKWDLHGQETLWLQSCFRYLTSKQQQWFKTILKIVVDKTGLDAYNTPCSTDFGV